MMGSATVPLEYFEKFNIFLTKFKFVQQWSMNRNDLMDFITP